MIVRSRSAESVNRIIQRDFPEADVSEAVREPLHVVLLEGESGALFMWRGPRTYEVHTFLECHGRAALHLMHRLLDHMRHEYGAERFWALIPEASRPVKIFTRWMGWKSEGVLETMHGPCELFVSENAQCHQS